MGTRHLIMVELNNEFKVAQYGQWDGYPEGQGKTVLEFLSSPLNIGELKTKLSNVRFLDIEGKDKKLVEEYNKNSPEWSNDPDNRTDEQKHWSENYLSRDIGAKILSNIVDSEEKEIILKNGINFIKDSLMCEWAYNINLDKNELEIYRGFQTEPDKNNKFGSEKSEGYYPCKLIKKYSFDKLPDVETLKKECDPDEDED